MHFFAIGAALLVVAPRDGADADVGVASGADAARSKIVVDAASIAEALRAEEARTGRVLDADARRAMIARLVADAVLAREAVRLGVGLDDPEMTARLASRMRRDLARAASDPPTEGVIEAEATRLAAAAPPRLVVSAWFVASAIARGDRAGAEALADRAPIPAEATWTEELLARAAGPSVAQAAVDGEVGVPTSPVASTWGYFVLVVRERRAATPEEMRGAAAETVRARAAEEGVARLVARARRDYVVEVESLDSLAVEARAPYRPSAARGANEPRGPEAQRGVGGPREEGSE